ncbi:hypothetical protein AVEN_97377-1, partial [Araneus ventricosus]
YSFGGEGNHLVVQIGYHGNRSVRPKSISAGVHPVFLMVCAPKAKKKE